MLTIFNIKSQRTFYNFSLIQYFFIKWIPTTPPQYLVKRISFYQFNHNYQKYFFSFDSSISAYRRQLGILTHPPFKLQFQKVQQNYLMSSLTLILNIFTNFMVFLMMFQKPNQFTSCKPNFCLLCIFNFEVIKKISIFIKVNRSKIFRSLRVSNFQDNSKKKVLHPFQNGRMVK